MSDHYAGPTGRSAPPRGIHEALRDHLVGLPRGAELPGVPRLPRPAVPRRVRRRARGAPGAHRRARRAAAGLDPFTGDDEFKEEWFGEDDEGNSLHEVGLRGGWDAATRDKELDNDGVTGEVVFPGPDAATGTNFAPFGAGFNPVATRSPAHLLAGARAYNRWAAELCQASPERRAGLIVAPILDDLDGAIAEIRRAHDDGLRGGVIIPPRWGDHESYTSYRYDPVWAACEELDLPVHCHSGPGAHEEYGEVPGWMSVYGFETIFFTSRPMWFMLLTGVFERFPRLRMAITEAGSFWAADMLWRLDMMATRDHGARKMADTRGQNTLLPSEYFDRNCKIGSSNTRRREIARRYEIGVGNIMWGNDFPHPEGTWPYTASSSRTASGTCRCTRPSRCSGSTRPSSTTSTSRS